MSSRVAEPRVRSVWPWCDTTNSAGEARRQGNDQRAEHAVGFLRILVHGEELARRIDQQVVQFGHQAAALRQSQIAMDAGQRNVERGLPVRRIAVDAAGRDLPGVAHARIEPRLIRVAMLCGCAAAHSRCAVWIVTGSATSPTASMRSCGSASMAKRVAKAPLLPMAASRRERASAVAFMGASPSFFGQAHAVGVDRDRHPLHGRAANRESPCTLGECFRLRQHPVNRCLRDIR